jgi:hypothetical protein
MSTEANKQRSGGYLTNSTFSGTKLSGTNWSIWMSLFTEFRAISMEPTPQRRSIRHSSLRLFSRGRFASMI